MTHRQLLHILDIDEGTLKKHHLSPGEWLSDVNIDDALDVIVRKHNLQENIQTIPRFIYSSVQLGTP